MAGSPVNGAVISTLSLGLGVKASELFRTSEQIMPIQANTTLVQTSPDSDNDDFADGGEGKNGMMTKGMTWIGPHLQRLQGANLRLAKVKTFNFANAVVVIQS